MGSEKMSYFEALKKIKANQIPSVILLYGTEAFFIQQLKEEIMKKLKIDEENISNYDLEENPIEEVVADAETYPFFAEKKLIIASNPVFLKTKQPKLPFEHHMESLEAYIENPVDYSIIVFIAPYEKVDSRKKTFKLMKKNGLIAQCQEVKEYELDKWIKNLADSLGIRIAPEAYEIFITELQLNLQLIRNELMKMAIYVGEDGIITKEVAEDLIAKTANSSALRLVDAVVEKDFHKAIVILKDLEKLNEEPIALIALLAFQFRTLLQVKLLKAKGYSQAQVQKQLAMHPYVIKIAYQREKSFTKEQLEAIILKLADADATMKQGTMEKALAFELLLYELTQKIERY